MGDVPGMTGLESRERGLAQISGLLRPKLLWILPSKTACQEWINGSIIFFGIRHFHDLYGSKASRTLSVSSERSLRLGGIKVMTLSQSL